MATHSSSLVWEIPWIEEPGGLVHGIAESDTTERLHFHYTSILFFKKAMCFGLPEVCNKRLDIHVCICTPKYT